MYQPLRLLVNQDATTAAEYYPQFHCPRFSKSMTRAELPAGSSFPIFKISSVYNPNLLWMPPSLLLKLWLWHFQKCQGTEASMLLVIAA